MTIRGSTRVLGVFGDPVVHSLSPRMHAEFARSTGADTVYVPFHVRSQHLETALLSLPALSLLGVNLTVPHKEKALHLLPEVEPAAREIGAVNTVINRDGHLVGDNTDGEGFLDDLRAQFPDERWAREPVLVVGAGGAARAVVHGLRQAGVPQLLVANRNAQRAETLVEELAPEVGEPVPLEKEKLQTAIGQAGLIVNTTSLGLHGETLPGVDLNAARPGTAVYDLIYNPPETPFLSQAGKLALPAANGLGMLVRQGAASYLRWTGKQPSPEPVIQLLEKLLMEGD